MRAALALAIVLLTGCAARLDAPQSACSDPLGLYTATAYQGCCLAHDADYRAGGTEADRLAADQRIYLCVARWSEDDAASMFVALRLFGAERFRYRKD
jgi:hypothetical protein